MSGGASRALRRATGVALAGLATACAVPAPEPEPPNVLLLTIDTLRADHLSAYGYPRATTPVLDRLIAEGAKVELAQTQWPKTGPSFASMFTSTYPKDNGVVRKVGVPVPCEYRLLAEELRDLGYRTSAVVANGAVGREFHFDQGFDAYVEAWKGSQGREAIEVATRPDRVTDLAIEALAGLDGSRPFFLWVHYLDPHFPYRPPEPWRDAFQGDAWWEPEPRILLDRERASRSIGGIGREEILDDRDELAFYVARYDAEIRFTDQEIERLIDALRERGLWDRMLTVFTSDHGESLGENGLYFSHGRLPYQNVLRVPLAFRYPGVIEPATVIDDGPVELLDVAPTILEVAGARLDDGTWRQGRSLLRRFDGRESGAGALAFSEAGYGVEGRWMKAVTDGRFKLVSAPRGDDQRFLAGRGRHLVLYDLTADPEETTDVADRHPEAFRELSRQLARRIRSPKYPVDAGEPACDGVTEADPETLDQLHALGYL